MIFPITFSIQQEKIITTLLFLILFWFPILKTIKKFRIPPNFLSKGYIEREVTIPISSNITTNLGFTDSDFAVSIVVHEEDFEDSNDTLLAPPVPSNPSNKYFDNCFPNYNNT